MQSVRRLRSLPVLVVYTLFFLVQWFYNIDTPSVPNYAGSISITGKTGKAERLSHSHGQENKGGKIRLNKRFHPSAAAFTLFSADPVYVYPPATLHMISYHAALNIPGTTVIHSLRGPPVSA